MKKGFWKWSVGKSTPTKEALALEIVEAKLEDTIKTLAATELQARRQGEAIKKLVSWASERATGLEMTILNKELTDIWKEEDTNGDEVIQEL